MFVGGDILEAPLGSLGAVEFGETLIDGELAGEEELPVVGLLGPGDLFDEERERDFIEKAASSIEKTCGARPSGWLSRYLHTPNTHRLLIEEGYSYHMDDLSDDVPFWFGPRQPYH